jgi:hypothetical protein
MVCASNLGVFRADSIIDIFAYFGVPPISGSLWFYLQYRRLLLLTGDD